MFNFKSNRSFFFSLLFAVLLTLGMSVSLQALLAWDSPTAPPPGANKDAPINVGVVTQSKAGRLQVGDILTASSSMGVIGQFEVTTNGGPFVVSNTMGMQGNVGIGTVNPQYPLDVVGKVRISGAAAGLIFPDGTIQATAATGSGGQWTTSGNNIYNANTGNVGIGTTNLVGGYKLAIEGGSVRLDNNTSMVTIDLNRNGSAFKTGIWFRKNGNSMWSLGVDKDDNGGDNFWIGDNTGAVPSTRFIIDTNGNVGIGTENPGYKLDVAGDINFTGTLYKNGVAFSGGGGDALGARENKNSNSAGNPTQYVYQAPSDGLVVAYGDQVCHRIFADNNNPPTTVRAQTEADAVSANWDTITIPVKRGEYWRVVRQANCGNDTVSVYWTPLTGSGGAGIYRTATSSAATSCDAKCGGSKCLHTINISESYIMTCSWTNGGFNSVCVCSQ